jgi:hypothetical protein
MSTIRPVPLVAVLLAACGGGGGITFAYPAPTVEYEGGGGFGGPLRFDGVSATLDEAGRTHYLPGLPIGSRRIVPERATVVEYAAGAATGTAVLEMRCDSM